MATKTRPASKKSVPEKDTEVAESEDAGPNPLPQEDAGADSDTEPVEAVEAVEVVEVVDTPKTIDEEQRVPPKKPAGKGTGRKAGAIAVAIILVAVAVLGIYIYQLTPKAPVAKITSSESDLNNLLAGKLITFDASRSVSEGSGDVRITKYAWDFGDGEKAEGKVEPFHVRSLLCSDGISRGCAKTFSRGYSF